MTEDGGEKLAVVATRDKEATVVVGRGFCPRKKFARVCPWEKQGTNGETT